MAHVVDFTEGSLTCVTLCLLLVFGHNTAEKTVFRARCGGDLAVFDQLRAKKGRLIQMIEGVGIIAGHVDDDDGCFLDHIGKIELVYTVKAVRASRGAKGDKLTIDFDLVGGRTRQTQNSLSGTFRNGAEGEPKVHFRFSVVCPDGTCRGKRNDIRFI